MWWSFQNRHLQSLASGPSVATRLFLTGPWLLLVVHHWRNLPLFCSLSNGSTCVEPIRDPSVIPTIQARRIRAVSMAFLKQSTTHHEALGPLASHYLIRPTFKKRKRKVWTSLFSSPTIKGLVVGNPTGPWHWHWHWAALAIRHSAAPVGV